MLTNHITERLENDADWQHLQRHIEGEINSLDTLADIDFSDKEKAAIEGRARALAKEKLLAILEPFGGGEEESTADKKNHVASKTGVVE